jgi:hypothetical protein
MFLRNRRYGATDSANSGDATAHQMLCWSRIAAPRTRIASL